MKSIFATNPEDFKSYTTERLRNDFLVTDLMLENQIKFVYSHYDRFILGGVVPTNSEIVLPVYEELKANYFLERRELGVINTGNNGIVICDGISFSLLNSDCLYVPMGTKEVSFKSEDAATPAKFFLSSTPAHHAYVLQKMSQSEAVPVNLGAKETCNERTIYKYIHNDGLKSCQLVMGLTKFKEGSIWNSVPPHTHNRRMEVYFYFDLPESSRVFHFMGEPSETRHLVVANNNAIISPPWSVHFGVGSSSYCFIWAMAGENKEFTDMDVVQLAEIS